MVAARRDRVAWMRQGVPRPVPAARRRTATREVEPSRHAPTAPRGRGRGTPWRIHATRIALLETAPVATAFEAHDPAEPGRGEVPGGHERLVALEPL